MISYVKLTYVFIPPPCILVQCLYDDDDKLIKTKNMMAKVAYAYTTRQIANTLIGG